MMPPPPPVRRPPIRYRNARSATGSGNAAAAAQAGDPAVAPQPQAGQAEGQSINNAIAQPQIQSNTATPATPQYNVAVVTGAAVPLNGLAVQIAVTALSGKSRFEIRLDPDIRV
jgi:flagellar hook-length control protein FliK